MVRTAIIFETIPEGYLRYLVVDGDKSHLHHVYVGGKGGTDEEELMGLIFDSKGRVQHEVKDIQEFREALLDKNVKLICCGFYL